MFTRRAASEFPNDNPELHDGLVWACPRPLARAMPTLRLREPQGALPNVLMPAWDTVPSPRIEAPEERADEPSGLADDSPVPPAVVNGPFEVFVGKLSQVALRRSSPRTAAALQALLEQGRLTGGALEEAATRLLVGKRILDTSGRQFTPDFRAAVDAWRGVLEGTASDIAACGDRTLDVWAAELVAAFVSASSAEVADLRRELRRAGVAAFGLLAVA